MNQAVGGGGGVQGNLQVQAAPSESPKLAESPKLVKRGLSEFQRMWVEVYQKAEQVNRNSSVYSQASQGPQQIGNPQSQQAVSVSAGRTPREGTIAAGQEGVSSEQGLNMALLPHQLAHRVQVRGAGQTTALASKVGQAIMVKGLPVQGAKSALPTLYGNAFSTDLLLANLEEAQAGTASAPVKTAEVEAFRQIMDQLRALNPQDGQTIVFNVSPPGLGDLRVEVYMEKSEVRAELVTSHPEVQELLMGNSSSLEEALARQGMSVGKFSVDLGDPNGYFKEAERRDRRETVILKG